MIYLSDVGRAVPQLPDNLRGLPFDTLFPVVLDRIIDHQALVAAARRQHLDDDPAVKRDIEAATSRLLEGALLAREAVTDRSRPAMPGNMPASRRPRRPAPGTFWSRPRTRRSG